METNESSPVREIPFLDMMAIRDSVTFVMMMAIIIVTHIIINIDSRAWLIFTSYNRSWPAELGSAMGVDDMTSKSKRKKKRDIDIDITNNVI